MSASVSFDGLSRVIKDFEKRGGNLSLLMPRMAELLVSAVQGKFEQQGPGWPPLAPATIARRRASSSPKILTDTGNLAGSITRAWSAREAEAYTEVPYAGFHVTGTSRMPVRDFTDLEWEPLMVEVEQLVLLSAAP